MISMFACCAGEDELRVKSVKSLLYTLLDADIFFDTDVQCAAMGQEAAREIEQRELFLFLASAASNASPRCIHELRYAIALGRRVLFISLDGSGKPSACADLSESPVLMLAEKDSALSTELADMLPQHVRREELYDDDDALDQWLMQRIDAEIARSKKGQASE